MRNSVLETDRQTDRAQVQVLSCASQLKRALPEEVSDDLVRLPGMISCQILDALIDALSDNSPSAIS